MLAAYLRHGPAPADQGLARAPWDTFHALMAAVPCPRYSLSAICCPVGQLGSIVLSFQRAVFTAASQPRGDSLWASLSFPVQPHVLNQTTHALLLSLTASQLNYYWGFPPKGPSCPSLKSVFISAFTVPLTLLTLSIGSSPFEGTETLD